MKASLLLALASLASGREQAPDVDRHIADLGSEGAETREKAMNDLMAAGLPALEKLKKALSGQPPQPVARAFARVSACTGSMRLPDEPLFIRRRHRLEAGRTDPVGRSSNYRSVSGADCLARAHLRSLQSVFGAPSSSNFARTRPPPIGGCPSHSTRP